MPAPQIADPFIPEPQQDTAAAIALLDAWAPATTTLSAQALEASLDEWGKQRAVITRYISKHFVEGTDYYTITVKGVRTKPTLGKPGAEKFLSLFQLQASFRQDADTWEMLGRPPGILCYVCQLTTRSGQVVGEGRGARDIKKDAGDINKAVKMGSKSALIDAILRTGALSDAFTQDLGEEGEDHAASPPPPPNPVLEQEIVALLKHGGFTGTTRGALRAEVTRRTGLAWSPTNYTAILEALKPQAA